MGHPFSGGTDSVVQADSMTTGEPEDQPSPRMVEQRVRNRLIEYFEWASSFDEQREYQAVAPVAVAGEVFNQWDDWTGPEPVTADSFGPVYSCDEVEAMLSYDSVLTRAIDETFQGLAIWEELRQAAADALTVFRRRGTLPEDHEV
jgi:hypothetical protein